MYSTPLKPARAAAAKRFRKSTSLNIIDRLVESFGMTYLQTVAAVYKPCELIVSEPLSPGRGWREAPGEGCKIRTNPTTLTRAPSARFPLPEGEGRFSSIPVHSH